MSTGRTPDWDFSALNKDTGAQGKVGAGWNNDDGTISIVLNPCVVLNANDSLSIRLFKRGETYKQKPRQTPPGQYANADEVFKAQERNEPF